MIAILLPSEYPKKDLHGVYLRSDAHVVKHVEVLIGVVLIVDRLNRLILRDIPTANNNRGLVRLADCHNMDMSYLDCKIQC